MLLRHRRRVEQSQEEQQKNENKYQPEGQQRRVFQEMSPKPT
jgi:hypothetical protein